MHRHFSLYFGYNSFSLPLDVLRYCSSSTLLDFGLFRESFSELPSVLTSYSKTFDFFLLTGVASDVPQCLGPPKNFLSSFSVLHLPYFVFQDFGHMVPFSLLRSLPLICRSRTSCSLCFQNLFFFRI